MSIKDVGPTPHQPRVVTVVTGSEARPAGPAPVIWAGGTTAPINMTAADFWFKANAAGVMPVGGTTGQVLKKVSATDYDVAWQADAGGGLGVVASITDPATEFVGHYTIVDDGSGEGVDRLRFTYDPLTGVTHTTFWLNGYAEPRATPRASNTVGFRVYVADDATEYTARDAATPVFEMTDQRDGVRTTQIGFYKGGNAYFMGDVDIDGALTVGGVPITGGGATSGNIDGGTPTTNYGGITPIDGGTP